MTGKLETVIIRRPKIRRSVTEASDEFILAGPAATPANADIAREVAEGTTVTLDETTPQEASRIAAEPDVAEVLPNMPFLLPKTQGAGSNAGVAPSMNWGIEAIGADRFGEDAGKNIVVAVLDTGLKADHPSFAGMDIEFKNFTDETDVDIDGHGTHCAGTIFGRDVNGTRIGVARGVQKALIAKVLGAGGGSTGIVVNAMRWALLQNAQIISMSLGMDFPGFREKLENRGFAPQQATSIALAGYRKNIRVFDRLSSLLALQEAGVGGAVVVSAAGNESKRPDFAITVAPPAAGEHFVSVAAIDESRAIAPFSNDEADISGPGVGIWSAALDGGVRPDSGTSMAAPHVAGAAVLWAEHIAGGGPFDASRVQRELVSGAQKLPALSVRDIGAGLVRVPT